MASERQAKEIHGFLVGVQDGQLFAEHQ